MDKNKSTKKNDNKKAGKNRKEKEANESNTLRDG